MENKNLSEFSNKIPLFHVISAMVITFSDNIPTVFFYTSAEIPGTIG